MCVSLCARESMCWNVIWVSVRMARVCVCGCMWTCVYERVNVLMCVSKCVCLCGSVFVCVCFWLSVCLCRECMCVPVSMCVLAWQCVSVSVNMCACVRLCGVFMCVHTSICVCLRKLMWICHSWSQTSGPRLIHSKISYLQYRWYTDVENKYFFSCYFEESLSGIFTLKNQQCYGIVGV